MQSVIINIYEVRRRETEISVKIMAKTGANDDSVPYRSYEFCV